MSKGRKDDLIVPLTCRHPLGLTFALGASLGVSCCAARSPSQAVRGLGLAALAAMLPLLRITKSLFLLLVAMLQCLDPEKENDMKSTSYSQAGKYVEETGKILKHSALKTKVPSGVVREWGKPRSGWDRTSPPRLSSRPL